MHARLEFLGLLQMARASHFGNGEIMSATFGVESGVQACVC